MLDMRGRERDKTISLEKIKDTHPKEFCNNANMVAIIKAVLQMDAFSGSLVPLRRSHTLNCWDRSVIMLKAPGVQFYLHPYTFALLG